VDGASGLTGTQRDDSVMVTTPPGFADKLALLTKVALMYHEEEMKQKEIAAELNIPQTRVSRMLAVAAKVGIVRTTVVPPADTHVHLERALRRRYDLLDVAVAPAIEGHDHRLLGGAAADLLSLMLGTDEVIGISPWSDTLLAVVDAMHVHPRRVATQIVQLVGGVGNRAAQVSATRLAVRLAEVTGGEPVFVAAPGVVANRDARDALLSDAYVRHAVDAWSTLTTALVGIGAPLDPWQRAGSTVSEEDQQRLREAGSVGDVCLHFFDAQGRQLATPFQDRRVGIPADVLTQVPRRVAVAGGLRKTEAIRAALLGGWINVLVTDSAVAAALLDEPLQK
jgi:DNA-binding transcriptional regulator LsrR (DeoR family)